MFISFIPKNLEIICFFILIIMIKKASIYNYTSYKINKLNNTNKKIKIEYVYY